jgi:hypothetical protein
VYLYISKDAKCAWVERKESGLVKTIELFVAGFQSSQQSSQGSLLQLLGWLRQELYRGQLDLHRTEL